VVLTEAAKISYDACCEASYSVGGVVHRSWEGLPKYRQRWYLEIGIDLLVRPGLGPDFMHESWLKQKTRQGWKYGEKKNTKTKEHPFMVPYYELPLERKLMYIVFRATLTALKDNNNDKRSNPAVSATSEKEQEERPDDASYWL